MKYATNRRNVLFGATLAALTLGSAGVAPRPAAADGVVATDAVTYVRLLYQRAATGRALAVSKKEFLGLLSGDLRRLWQVQAQVQAPPPQNDAEFVRAVMFGPKLQRAGELALRGVSDIPGLPHERMVAVEFTAGKEPHQVFVHLAPVGPGGWVIVNFIYDEGDDFRRTTERQRSPAG